MAKDIEIKRIRMDVYEIPQDLEKVKKRCQRMRSPTVIRREYGVKFVEGYKLQGATIFVNPKDSEKIMVYGDIHTAIKHLNKLYKSYKFVLKL